MASANTYQVVVVGAGISGLMCAYRLAAAGIRTALVESGARAGGIMQSDRVNGFLLERGPGSVLAKPSVLSLIDELGLRDKAEFQHMKHHQRFIWRNGKLRRVPTGPFSFFASTLLSAGEKYEILHGFVARHRPPSTDIELGAYCRERLGNGAVAALLKPALAGIYAADADRISLESIAPKLFPVLKSCEKLSQVPKALKARAGQPNSKPMRALVSFENGLAAIPEALADQFRAAGGDLRLGCAVQEITQSVPGSNSLWRVRLSSGEELDCERLVLTQPAFAAATILEPVAAEVAQGLEQIEYAPLAVVYIGASEDHFRDRRHAFGFLTMQNQGVRMLGAIWNDRVFARRASTGQRLLTCFYGGEIDPEAAALPDPQLREQAVQELSKTMGLKDSNFALFEITRHENALPIFRVGHMQRMQRLQALVPNGVHLLGSYLGGLSVPDRIETANNEARAILSGISAETRAAVA